MSKEPVAWVTPQDLIDMRANALIGTKDWFLTVGLKPEKGDVPLYTAPLQSKEEDNDGRCQDFYSRYCVWNRTVYGI